MPFATLPSSPGFNAPQAPSWTPFASQAIELRAHQPIPDTAAAVNQAVGQINQILQLNSPQAKLERSLHLQQLQTMQEVYRDYKLHPENYTMTANGPVRTDPYKRMATLAGIQHTVASTNYLNKRMNQGTPAFIKDAMTRMQAAQNAEKQGVSLPSSRQVTAEPSGQTTNTSNSDDNSAADAAALYGNMTNEPSVSSDDVLNNPFKQ